MKKRTVALVLAFLCIAIVITPTIILLQPTWEFLFKLLGTVTPWFFIVGIVAVSGIIAAIIVLYKKRKRL